MKEAFIESQPLGRVGSVRDIADSTVFLFANTGSYINGHVLVGELSVHFAFYIYIHVYIYIYIYIKYTLTDAMGIVDGSSWRTSSEISYPGFLLVGGEFENVRGKKKKSKI